VFTRIHLHFKVRGRELDPKKVARAVSLSADKYCSASIMLSRGGVAITHSHEVVDA
jgi:putative redox protein